MTIGGTSAVAPLYAGLFAAFGTKLGFVTPELYLNQVCFNDITEVTTGLQSTKRPRSVQWDWLANRLEKSLNC